MLEKVPQNYREFLIRTFEERNSRKPNYSLRAFARDLGISIASLSLIFAAKQGLSIEKAKEISNRLGLKSEEERWFVLNVQSLHHRSPRIRSRAKNELLKAQVVQTHALEPHEFDAISKWYYFAILELIELKGFKSDPAWIASRLGINPKIAEAAVHKLVKAGYISWEKGQLKQNLGFTSAESLTPSRTIREFHRQILSKAETALLTQPNPQRDFSAVIFSLEADDLDWAKHEIKSFRRKLAKRLASKPRKTKLYCLSMQLFNLIEKEEN